MTDTNITLELSPKLQQEQIVTSYIFDLKINSIVVELNHKYDKKTIISKIVKDDWTKTIEKFQSQMRQSGVSQEHITMITDVAESQYQSILPPIIDDKRVKPKFIQKYRTDDLLAEAIIIGDEPYFAVATNGGIILEESIRDFKPPSPTSYMNKPYAFKSKKEFDDLVEKAKHETIDSLYNKVKNQWKKYDAADDLEISLCAADTIFTYFQDSLGMTHYLFFVGSPDSGKSNRLLVFNFLAYRNFMSTDVTPSNIYRFLGSLQEGQGTICEDEADDLDESPEKMKIYKSGYTAGFKVARNEDSINGGMSQSAYCTYGFKIFSAERLPDSTKAKGLVQRLIELKCLSAIPQWDISEVANPAFADEFVKQLDELKELRNTLFAYRLVHYNDKIPNIQLNITNREKQLFKPLLRVFQSTDTQSELLKVVSHFIRERRELNTDSLHSTLYRLIKFLVDTENTYEFESSRIWGELKEWLAGSDISYKPLSYESSQFGTISQKQITEILKSDFSAKSPSHNSNKAKLTFDKPILDKLEGKYNTDLNVEVSESSEEDLETKDDPTHDPTQQNHAQNRGFEEDEEDVQQKGGLNKGTPKGGLEERDISSSSNNKHNPTHTKETEREDKSEDRLASSSTYSKEPDFEALSAELEKRYKPTRAKV
jgi:hypothetical protein